jgi:hypothetical protein
MIKPEIFIKMKRVMSEPLNKAVLICNKFDVFPLKTRHFSHRNNRLLFFFIILCCPFFLFNCSEEEQEAPNDLVYRSLVAEKDTIAPGGTVKVTATATGSQLKYYWSASLGDIHGAGAQVTYAASPCSVGENQVHCKITNGSTQSETKTVEIVVYE